MQPQRKKCPQCGFEMLTNEKDILIAETLSAKPLKWAELLSKVESKMSRGSLSRHLNMLINAGLVKAELAQGTRDIVYSIKKGDKQ